MRGAAINYVVFMPDMYRQGARAPKHVNDPSDPKFGFWVGGDRVKPKDGDDNHHEPEHYALPMSINAIYKGKKPCSVCGKSDYQDIRGTVCDRCAFPDGVRKAETFPHRVYEDQRKDVCKFVRESSTLEARNIALRPKHGGFVGVFFDEKEKPYLFAMNSMDGLKFKAAPDDWGAYAFHQKLLDREGRISIKLSQRETYDALNDFAERLSKGFPKPKEEKVKQAKPMPNAGRKVAGAGGKTRYSYAAQGKEKGQPGRKPAAPKKSPNQMPMAASSRTAPRQVDSPSIPNSPNALSPANAPEPFVDPAKLATMLQTTTEVLRRMAKKFVKHSNGRKEFVEFFQKRFRKLCEKHKIGGHYLRLLYQALTQPTQEAMP